MNLNLKNKTVVVTGSSSGIGSETARIFAEEGADVVVCYHQNKEGADQTAESVRFHGRRALTCRMDIADPRQVQSAIGTLQDRFTKLDILILNAGECRSANFSDITPQSWSDIVAVNLNGPFYVLHEMLPLLGKGSSVVAVSSVSGQTGVPLQAHYAAAKAGLINLTKSAARALAPDIRVNCVAPGMTLTEMGRATAAKLPNDYARHNLLVERFAEPQEIAKAVVFLASPICGFITGATLDVNGGRYLR